MSKGLTPTLSKGEGARTLIYLFVSLFFLLSFLACKTTKKIPVANPADTRADYKSPKVLASLLRQSEFNFSTLSAKFSCDAVIDSNKNSFNVAMRIKKDSAIWMSISPALGIEVARALITKDSVKFIDRIHTTYFAGDFNYISKMLHTELDYEIIQSLLIGNSVEFYDDDERLRSGAVRDSNQYTLSTIRKRKLKKVLEGNKETKEPLQSIWMENGTYKIRRILFHDFNTNREFDAFFDKFGSRVSHILGNIR